MKRTAVLPLVYLPVGFICLIVLGLIIWFTATGKSLPFSTGKTAPPKVFYEIGQGRFIGKFILEDGSPNDKNIILHSLSHRVTKESDTYKRSMHGPYTDSFDIEAQSGTTYLLAYREGYAPAGLEPFENHANGVIEDIVIQLTKGAPLVVKLVDDSGLPFQGAMVTAYAKWDQDNTADITPKEISPGVFRIEHASPEMDYRFTIEVEGFEYASITVDKSKVGGSETITLKYADPTTGTVVDLDGTPVKGAAIMLTRRMLGTRGHVYFGGKEIAITDNNGDFSLSNIPRDEYFYGFIMAPEGRRILFENIQAGQRGLKFTIPKSQRIHCVVTGSGYLLKTRSFPIEDNSTNKPYVQINHRYIFEDPTKSPKSGLITDDEQLQEVDGHWEFTSKGLFADDVELIIGPYRVPIDPIFLGQDSDILVDFDLDTGKSHVRLASESSLPPASSSENAAPVLSTSNSSE